MRALCWLVLVVGCGGKAPQEEDFSSLGDVKSDSFSSKMRLLGSLVDGQTRKVYYTSSPLYRGYTLDGAGPIDLWVRSDSGDALAWLLDSKFHVVKKNDDADDSTYDAHLKGTLPDDQTYYLVMRDYDQTKGWFSVERVAQDPLACEGSGLIATIPDECMDDGGINGVGDGLEVYCFKGKARFCLTGESCPWRRTLPSRDNGKTCSHAGLEDSPESEEFGQDFMAHAPCSQWQGHEWYYCNPEGDIRFSVDGR